MFPSRERGPCINLIREGVQKRGLLCYLLFYLVVSCRIHHHQGVFRNAFQRTGVRSRLVARSPFLWLPCDSSQDILLYDRWPEPLTRQQLVRESFLCSPLFGQSIKRMKSLPNCFFSFDEGISQNSRAVKAITSATSADSRKRMIKRGEVVTFKDEVFRRLVDDDLSLTIIK